MKKLLAVLSALLLVFSVAVPAHAAELSASEKVPYEAFKKVLDYWSSERGILDADHANQYLSEVETALAKLDLNQAACDEFTQAVSEVDTIFRNANAQSRADLYAHVNEACAVINRVGAKYYNINVTVDPQTKYARVTFQVPGSGTSGTVVADTSNVVRQTGFDLTQSVIVAAGCACVLAASVVVARKRQLFV